LEVCALAATEKSRHIAEMKNVLDVNTRFIIESVLGFWILLRQKYSGSFTAFVWVFLCNYRCKFLIALWCFADRIC
jgi:hypothetical protein